ncbi:hypothetical protein ACFLXZ_01850 [Chloroflexota bacterium]
MKGKSFSHKNRKNEKSYNGCNENNNRTVLAFNDTNNPGEKADVPEIPAKSIK